ncbi:MAG TPA: tetratricopeptide repeat protein [bacterium]
MLMIAALCIIPVLSFAGPDEPYLITGRVLAVSEDGRQVVINKGANDRVLKDSLCAFRPNRGYDQGDVEWDILLASGEITFIGPDTAVIELTDVRDSVLVNDCCELFVRVPSFVLDSDLGKIAIWDIAFVDYDNSLPFFTLGGIISDPHPTYTDSIVNRMAEEIRSHPDAVDYGGDKVQGGIFNGMTVREAMLKTTAEHVKLYLEYVRYYPGRYINFDWYLTNTYPWWVFLGTKTAERDRKLKVIGPLLDSAYYATQRSDFHAAIGYYKRVLGQVPDHADAVKSMKLLNTILQDRKIVENDPSDVTTCFALGKAYYDIDLFDSALVYFRRARNLGYDSLDIDRNVGYVLVSQRAYKDARKIFEKLNKVMPRDENILKWLNYSNAREKQSRSASTLESYIMTGDIKYAEDNYDDAISEYKKALAIQPHSDRVQDLIEKAAKRRKAQERQTWAADYWEKGKFEEAKGFWQEAFGLCEEIGDTSAMETVFDEMADAMYDGMFYDDAIGVYERILEINSGSYDSYISLSNCYKAKKDYETAVSWAEKGITVDPQDAWAYNILGLIYKQTKKYDQAIEYFLKASEMDEEYKYPNYNAALVYVAGQEYEKARIYLHKALEIDIEYSDARYDLVALECLLETSQKVSSDPDDADTRLRYGRALYNLEDYSRAITELNTVIAKRGDDAVAWAYLGFAYNESGQLDKARDCFERSYKLHPYPNIKAWIFHNEGTSALENDPYDPAAYLKLADSDLYWEYFDEALSDCELALQMGADTQVVYEKSAIARTGLQGNELYSTASDYYDRAEYDKAIEYADSACKVYESIGDIFGEMWALLKLGWSHANLFEHDRALEYYDRAGKVAELIFDRANKGNYLSAVGDYHWNMGDYNKALEYKKEARDIFHRNNDLTNEANVLISIGSLTGGGGEFDQMIEYYTKALDIHVKTMNYTGESYALGTLGWAYQDDGDFANALEYQKKALKIAQKYNDKWREMSAYSGIGNIYEDLGDTLNAIRYLHYYLDAATAIGSRTDRANALNTIGLVYLEIVKDYEKAYDFFVRSRDLSKATGYILGEGVAIANIGVTFSRRKMYTEAMPFHEQSLEIVRSKNASYQEMQGLNEYGETYLGLKDYDKALECFKRSIALADTIGVRREKWKYELNAGIAHEARGDLEAAVEMYKDAAATLTNIKNKIKSEQLKKGFSELDKQIDVYKRLVDILIRAGKPDEALKYIEESKSKIIKDAFGDIKPKAEDSNLQETLANVDKMEKQKETLEQKLVEERQKPANEQDQTKIRILSSTLATTEGEFNQWMLKLKFQNRKMYDALTINPTTLGDVQKDIPANTILLEYFISSDKLYIFGIGREQFIAKSVDVTEPDINATVDFYLGLLRDPQSGMDEDLKAASHKLYGYLIKPIEPEVSVFENIVVVPYGILYYLPFHALRRDDDQYVIQWKRLSYTTSATFADLLKQERGEMNSLLAIGNPDGSLPGAADEVKEVKDEVFKQDAIIWTLSEATKKKFLEQAKNYNIVHLATHGFIQNNPLESYLLFAGDNSEEQRLTLLEVAGYTSLRERTDLVFLSACQTAMEKGATSGSELISLAEAFAMAGPPTLIATLWQVSDVSTSRLVISFYTRLKRKKDDKLGALRDAQLELLATPEYAHPFYWAPFILIGNWR